MTTVALPASQHMTALGKANKTRLKRAKTKQSISSLAPPKAMVRVAEILESVPWECETMEISELLLCIPRMGWTHIRPLLHRVPVPENRRLGSSHASTPQTPPMTARQRTVLAKLLRERAARAAAR